MPALWSGRNALPEARQQLARLLDETRQILLCHAPDNLGIDVTILVAQEIAQGLQSSPVHPGGLSFQLRRQRFGGFGNDQQAVFDCAAQQPGIAEAIEG